ncbi:MAG: hypothetical protein ACTH1D_00360 [Mycobacteriaceae bacterium]|uniref:hypothetical protein n=1 Tax=Corynebacterium sp. TaxID=1720 RepID=UPI003F9E3669
MADSSVGQLPQLREITGRQLASHPHRSLGVLGIAGGNGLDLISPQDVDAVYGYDINPVYLATCEARFRHVLGGRLRLIEAGIDRTVVLEPVDLLIANLIVEYVGLDEFVAFIAANADRIGALSCVVQRNDRTAFVSRTQWTGSFDALGPVSSDIDADALTITLRATGFSEVLCDQYPLPNGKTLVRRDYEKL